MSNGHISEKTQQMESMANNAAPYNIREFTVPHFRNYFQVSSPETGPVTRIILSARDITRIREMKDKRLFIIIFFIACHNRSIICPWRMVTLLNATGQESGQTASKGKLVS